MEIWISSEMDSDIAEEFRIANNELEDELKPFLASKQYDLELDSLDCIAILRNDKEFEEIYIYSKKNRDIDFRLVINYGAFKSASFQRRKQLILEMVLRAVDILSNKKGINESAAKKLKADLQLFEVCCD